LPTPYGLSSRYLGLPSPPKASFFCGLTLRDIHTSLAPWPCRLLTSSCSWFFTLTHTHSHTHTLVDARHTYTGSDPAPTPGLTLRSTHTQLYPELRVPHPRNDLGREFKQKTGQTALIKHRAWPEKNTDQCCLLTLFLLLSICFAILVSPSNHLYPSLSQCLVPPLNIP